MAQGSLPLYLFGSDGYGTITGKIAAARLALGAAAPFAFAAATQSFGSGLSLFATAALGVVGMTPFLSVG